MEATANTAAPNGRPSKTAEVMALFRALESTRPMDERLFMDPLATQCLPFRGRALVGIARVPAVHRFVDRIIDRRWPGARTSAVARTRLIDDAISAAVRDGVRQVLLLGAGFDTRAHRLAALMHVRVFEVDRAVTQQEKIRRVARLVRQTHDQVRYIPLDFRGETLSAALRANGFDQAEPSVVVWEGVTNYLTSPSVDSTFRAMTESVAPGSQVLFTYVHAGLLDGSVVFVGGREILTRVREAGEPWTFGFDPQTLAAYLTARGLTLVEDLSADEYRATYFGRAARTMAGYSFYRVARAVVGPTRVKP
jgi:methyltransferase (TIGR00027 family)